MPTVDGWGIDSRGRPVVRHHHHPLLCISLQKSTSGRYEGNMGFKGDKATQKAVGTELLAVLPQDGVPWYKKAHMVKLHFCTFSLVMFCKSLPYSPIRPKLTMPKHLRTDTMAL